MTSRGSRRAGRPASWLAAFACGASLALAAPVHAQDSSAAAPARAPDATLSGEDREPAAGTARLTVASEPREAVVSIIPRTKGATDGPAFRRRGSDGLDHGPTGERVLGRTPVASDVPAGPVWVLVAKEGHVIKVEAIELQAGAAQRLEVRLTKDVTIPRHLSFKEAPVLARTPDDAAQLLDMVLRDVVTLFVDEKDPRALIDAAARTLVEALGAVRERETLLRRELGDGLRARFYGDEVDLRAYPALTYSETDAGQGRRRWSVGAGTLAVEGVTDPGEYDTYRKKLHAVYAFVKNRWDLAAKLDDSMLVHACIEGLLGSLDDPHTHFLSPAAWKDMGEETTGRFGGIGLVVGARDGGAITVVAPMDGSPGALAGVKTGDRILAIDGRSTEGMLLSEAIKLLRGEPDTTLELTIRRGAEPPFQVVVRRASIQARGTAHALLPPTTVAGALVAAIGSRTAALPAPAKVVLPRVGYVRIASFMGEKVDEEVAKGLDALETAGIDALVLDLRDNPGGLLQKAVQIADTFVPEGKTIVSTRGRLAAMTDSYAATNRPKRKRYPIAVLVNDDSASASEVLAGTLRGNGLAVLVGEKTYGKGSVQRVIPLEPFGSGLALTVATYHLPDGSTPNKVGLTPDVPVALTAEEADVVSARSIYMDPAATRDRQLDAAIVALDAKLRR